MSKIGGKMTDQEKLKKLLEFAGFMEVPLTNYWCKAPEGYIFPNPPDLLHSLDAQQKYLIPVLIAKYTPEETLSLLNVWAKSLMELKDPALAFAEAVLKMMKEPK